MDGTLMDTLDDLKDSVNYALLEFDMPQRTLADIRKFVGNGVFCLMELCVPKGIANPDFEQALDVFKEHYSKHCNDKTRPYNGTLELIKDLSEKGYKLAIVSNKYYDAVVELNNLYFSDYISVAIGEKEGIRKKPAPDTVQTALAMLDSKAEDSVYIGDSEVDIQTAKNSGLDCISASWGFRDAGFLKEHGANLIVDTPEQVSIILK
ncbi:MAG: HAD family hydrolase [Clostridia bacterium]|nr:HAD family hydrolase [Clostridia bacterium]